MDLVYAVIKREYPTYLKDEDIVQCGMLGLCKAANHWNPDKSKFSTYAWKCIRNEINNEFRNRCKHQNVYSLDYEMSNDEGDRVTLEDTVIGEPDVGYIDLDVDTTLLNQTENNIYEYVRQGYEIGEVADMLNISVQTVWKALRKIRRIRNGD